MTNSFTAEASDRAARIMARADALLVHTMVPGQLTRIYGSDALSATIETVASWMREVGMEVSRDAVGNLIGRWTADPAIPEPRTFVIGGHLDSVRDAGRYDGPLGVLSGIAFVEGLAATDRHLPFHVEVVGFADEEGVRFRTSYLGSRVFTGTFDSEALALTDPDGVTLEQAVREFGGDPERLSEATVDAGSLLGFIEVHIEQGPLLEQRKLPVGVVSNIVGSHTAQITITGTAGHAGTVPMALRRDALAAASEFVLAVERVAGTEDGLVGTVGQLRVLPGAGNVIPGRVELTLDLRHRSERVRIAKIAELQTVLDEIGARRGVGVDWRGGQGYQAIESDLDFVSRLIDAIADEGIEPIQLQSGAGHDAVVLSELTPVAMLFVRCKGGVSHNPAESITLSDVEVAIRVLDRFMLGIATTVTAAVQLEDEI